MTFPTWKKYNAYLFCQNQYPNIELEEANQHFQCSDNIISYVAWVLHYCLLNTPDAMTHVEFSTDVVPLFSVQGYDTHKQGDAVLAIFHHQHILHLKPNSWQSRYCFPHSSEQGAPNSVIVRLRDNPEVTSIGTLPYLLKKCCITSYLNEIRMVLRQAPEYHCKNERYGGQVSRYDMISIKL
jgi:hypothetical protein